MVRVGGGGRDCEGESGGGDGGGGTDSGEGGSKGGGEEVGEEKEVEAMEGGGKVAEVTKVVEAVVEASGQRCGDYGEGGDGRAVRSKQQVATSH